MTLLKATFDGQIVAVEIVTGSMDKRVNFKFEWLRYNPQAPIVPVIMIKTSVGTQRREEKQQIWLDYDRSKSVSKQFHL
jgi:hypothetical protein